MTYDFRKLSIGAFLKPVADASSALSRLDERIARSPVVNGWIERSHFTDACASLWLDGELVHLEDLVLRNAGADIRAPTNELVIAHDVLRTRQRIVAHPGDWAMSASGLHALVNRSDRDMDGTEAPRSADSSGEGRDNTSAPDDRDPLGDELDEIDAVIARSNAVLAAVMTRGRAPARQTDAHAANNQEEEIGGISRWRAIVADAEHMPAVLQAAIALDAWNALDPPQQVSWLGRLLAASLLRKAGLTTGAHLPSVNLGLKAIARERRMHRDLETRLTAFLNALVITAEAGLKEHDRLALARQVMERKLFARRRSSRLREVIDFVLSRPMVSGDMIAEELGISPQSARVLIQELALREMTGRGRFRAWGIL